MRLGGQLRLEEQLTLDRLLDDAFAPGRRRTTPIAAARVRARVAWDRPAEPAVLARGVGLLGRMAQAPAAMALVIVLAVGTTGASEPGSIEEPSVRVRITSSAPARDTDVLRLSRFRVAPPPNVNELDLAKHGLLAPEGVVAEADVQVAGLVPR